MALTDLMGDLGRAGARIEMAGDALRVTSGAGLSPELRAAVATHKPALLEVLRRADAMLARAPPGGLMPLFMLRDVAAAGDQCRSCGAESATWRCELCGAAATLAAERFMARRAAP